jgi:BirA family biotin operon repressor/biotin-[acetyl-CoA-carboxylase] ligase
MPHTGFSFEVLQKVDSTNNYAMAKVHAGMAKHGDACFTDHQTGGKGQRGKTWLTGIGQNLALTVILKPKQLNITQPFELSTAVSLATIDFFGKYAGDETSIKWPNDIYWRDRKAGGVLIENKFNGNNWKWAIAGVGININQTQFAADLINPVSLMQVTGKNFVLEQLARELHQLILKRTDELLTKRYELLLEEYNQHLFKIHQPVRLKKDNIVFETTIKGVSAQGQLLTEDAIEKRFEFGEVEWLMSDV